MMTKGEAQTILKKELEDLQAGRRSVTSLWKMQEALKVAIEAIGAIVDTNDSMRAPVQGQTHRVDGKPLHKPPGTISWDEHVKAWEGYRNHYRGVNQSAERIAERGGFGWSELLLFLGHEPTTWEPR